MGKRGPKPLPDEITAIRGGRNDRRNHEQPEVYRDEVEKPTGMSSGADQVWERLAPRCVRMGTLTSEDIDGFMVLCELRATAMMIARVKDEPTFTPLVIEAQVDSDGGTHIKHRENQILKMEKANASATRPYLDMFGLTPSSRPRLRVQKPKEPVSKWQGKISA